MRADGRLPAQVQGYAPYRTGVAGTEARPGPLAGSHPEAEGRGPASPVCDARRGARGADVGERLEVKVAELSGAERIRALAAEKLGMHEPKSTTLKVYGVRAEDGKNDGAPQKGGRPRQR